jgi:hypothetical protein
MVKHRGVASHGVQPVRFSASAAAIVYHLNAYLANLVAGIDADLIRG